MAKKRERGRPKNPRQLHRFQLNVYRDQINWLRRLRYRRDVEDDLTTAQVIRGILEAIRNSKIDLSQAASEEEITEAVSQAIRPSLLKK